MKGKKYIMKDKELKGCLDIVDQTHKPYALNIEYKLL